MEQNNPMNVFYSWQSDLSRDTNQKAISICIKKALTDIEENNNSIQLVYDEATRDEAGSPDIPSTILNKITRSDIFICDVTTVNSSDLSTRKMPNPNVLIELGYAISVLGWDRIIMVFNKIYGQFPNDLPFDIEKRKAHPYKIENKTDKKGKTDLTNKIKNAIELIIKKNPKKPSELKTKGEKEIKRDKDLSNLKIIISCINIPTIDLFISELPDKIIGRIFFFWYSFQSNYDSNTFHIFDSVLREKLDNFRNAWGKSLSFGNLFSPSSNGRDYILYLPMDVFTDEKSENDYNELSGITNILRKSFKDLIVYLRETYIEIEVNDLSALALQHFIDHEKGLLEDLEKINTNA